MNLAKKTTPWFPSIFEDLFVENRLDVGNYEKFSIPAVNIQEKNTNFVIELAVPGMKKDDFTIEIEEGTLKIASNSESQEVTEEKENDVRYTRKEFSYHQFSRSFHLPDTVNTDEIKAAYEDGILRVMLPKIKEQPALKKMVEIS
ncbi:Hsp20/alpha crystallin family protein [Altibacter sp. HG106]|uniref:Hsp20/alpha crystallin family protein n=1 Tax=Altibacter sp. HG106 TaxID=3023937 RepID=UPI00234FDB3C|nr:Hsp20/alpha crystallin family protein [Altibacter sp. HG106]MDC7993976.1 Hsp20/alpha crystallin family protein [Altibacter sp. HG106]